VDKKISEFLAVQLTTEALRQCYSLHTISKKSVWLCSREAGVSKASVYHILQSEKMNREEFRSRSEGVEYPPRSPDLTPLEFYLWHDLKNIVCTRNTAGPEARNRSCLYCYSTSKPDRIMTHCCTLLSTMNWGWL
jgi:hypothetical protein